MLDWNDEARGIVSGPGCRELRGRKLGPPSWILPYAVIETSRARVSLPGAAAGMGQAQVAVLSIAWNWPALATPVRGLPGRTQGVR